MARPRRRLVIGALLGVFVILTITVRLGWEWKQALDNVDAMIVPVVELPPATPAPAQQEAQPVVVIPTTPQPTPIPEPDAPINILLLGTDARPGEKISRTDAVLVVRIDPKSDRVSMLSLPRDLWVEVPGHGEHKINAAYPIGESELGSGYGAALAKKTVGELLDIPIHHFMLINFDGFKTLIDKLGGITVDIPEAIDDPKFPVGEFAGDNRTIKVHFDAGAQRLNGERALIYARTRNPDSDFGRNQRQQQVLLAIFDRVREQGALSQLTSLDDYTSALRDYIRTDMTRSQMLSIASISPRLDEKSIQRYAIESDMIVELKKPATFVADPKALKQLVNAMIGESVASRDDES